jgi:hypothetical protein
MAISDSRKIGTIVQKLFLQAVRIETSLLAHLIATSIAKSDLIAPFCTARDWRFGLVQYPSKKEGANSFNWIA